MYTFSIKSKELSQGVISAFFSSSGEQYLFRIRLITSSSSNPIPTLYLLTNSCLIVCKPTVEKQQPIPTPRQFHSILTSYQVSQVLTLPPGKFYSSGIHFHDDVVVVVFTEFDSNGLLFINTETQEVNEFITPVCEVVKNDDSSSR